MVEQESTESFPTEEPRKPFGWAGARQRMAERGSEANKNETGTPSLRKLRPSGRPTAPRTWGSTEAPPRRPDSPSEAPAQSREQPEAPLAQKPDEMRAPARPVARRDPGRVKGGDQLEVAKLRLHELLIEELEQGALDGMSAPDQRQAVSRAARELIAQEGIHLGGSGRDELIESVTDEVLGLGPLEPLLRDPSISEIMVNDINKVFYERDGKIFRSTAQFRDAGHVMRIIERIVAPLGRRIDESSPMVDARLPDGSRVNITIPPVSPNAASITIRKFRADKMTMPDLVSVGAMSEATAQFLAMCVRAKLNIIISGGTGTGKTTLLNALSSFISNTDRIVTIEDPSELRLQQEHVITLEARPPSMEGKNAVYQRDLVRNTLRMRPDRIIVGECRGPEAFDMLQAMNTGHDGSISTIHANNPREALARLENLVLMAGMELPAKAIREQISSAVDIFIQISRMQDGTRKVTYVTEIAGMEGDTVTVQDIFKFELDEVEESGRVKGAMKPTGIRPAFAEKFALAGITMPSDMFDGGKEW